MPWQENWPVCWIVGAAHFAPAAAIFADILRVAVEVAQVLESVAITDQSGQGPLQPLFLRVRQ